MVDGQQGLGYEKTAIVLSKKVALKIVKQD